MTRPAEETQDETLLLALLERSFPASAQVPDGFPRELWQRALLGPLREMLRRPGKAFRGRLVQLGHTLADGRQNDLPSEWPLLVELLHTGSLIVDDIEDDSPERRGGPALHRVCGAPLAINAGNWLYFWPFELLSQLPLSPAARLRAHDAMHACLLRCHEGQALDLAARVADLEQSQVAPTVTMVTALKTGSLVGLAMLLGAIAAGAPPRRQSALQALGRALGDALQMLDDLSGVENPRRRHKALEDLRLGRPTWLWAWLARDLSSAEYERLRRSAEAAELGEPADALLSQLHFRLSVTGRRRARRRVEQALAGYRASEGDHPALAKVQRAFDELERAYVEG